MVKCFVKYAKYTAALCRVKHGQVFCFVWTTVSDCQKINTAAKRWKELPKTPLHRVSSDKILHDSCSILSALSGVRLVSTPAPPFLKRRRPWRRVCVTISQTALTCRVSEFLISARGRKFNRGYLRKAGLCLNDLRKWKHIHSYTSCQVNCTSLFTPARVTCRTVNWPT